MSVPAGSQRPDRTDSHGHCSRKTLTSAKLKAGPSPGSGRTPHGPRDSTPKARTAQCPPPPPRRSSAPWAADRLQARAGMPPPPTPFPRNSRQCFLQTRQGAALRTRISPVRHVRDSAHARRPRLRRSNDLILPARGRGKIIITAACPGTGAAWTSTGTSFEPPSLKHRPDGAIRAVQSRPSWSAWSASTWPDPGSQRTGDCSAAAAACSAGRSTAGPGTLPARPRSARTWPPPNGLRAPPYAGQSEVAAPLEQSASVPVCPTVCVPSPSRTTRKLEKMFAAGDCPISGLFGATRRPLPQVRGHLPVTEDGSSTVRWTLSAAAQVTAGCVPESVSGTPRCWCGTCCSASLP